MRLRPSEGAVVAEDLTHLLSLEPDAVLLSAALLNETDAGDGKSKDGKKTSDHLDGGVASARVGHTENIGELSRLEAANALPGPVAVDGGALVE